MPRIIALDESGNSGSNLLSPGDPLFVMSSVNLTESQIAETEDHFSVIRAEEWKFSKFKRKPRQIDLFLEFAAKDWVNGDTVGVHVTHKRYFAITKMVDLIYEPLAHNSGVDLYEKGGAKANLLYTVLPIAIGESEFDSILVDFIDLIRKQQPEQLKEFSKRVKEAWKKLEEFDMDSTFNMLSPAVAGCERFDLWRPYVSKTELDPIVPSYFTVVEYWGRKLDSDFVLVSDESKELAKQRSFLEALSNQNLPSKKLPSVDGEWVQFPYRASSIEAVCSTSNRMVQVADLFAGATNSVIGTMALHQELDAWQKEYKEIFFGKNLGMGGYWPSQDVTPEELGAEHVRGEKPLDYVLGVLNKRTDEN